MILNNFSIIGDYIEDDSKDYFYVLSIIRRGKDHPDLPSANYTIKSFCILGRDDLYKYGNEIITLCKACQSRAYIDLRRFSNRKCIEATIKNCAERLLQTDCIKPERIWWKSISDTKPEKKLWLIDCDTKDKDINISIIKYLESNQSKVELIIPTMQGYHIICTPFDSRDFPEEEFKSELKKQALTLLYYDNLEE